MAKSGVRPNSGTLNAVLRELSEMKWEGAVDRVMATVAEFTALGIEPTLGSYIYLAKTHTRNSRKGKTLQSQARLENFFQHL